MTGSFSNIGKSVIHRKWFTPAGIMFMRRATSCRTRSSAGLDTRSGPATKSARSPSCETELCRRVRRQEFRDRTFQRPVGELQPQQSECARLLGIRFDLVRLLARQRGGAAGNADAAHAPALLERRLGDGEVGATKHVARVDDLADRTAYRDGRSRSAPSTSA